MTVAIIIQARMTSNRLPGKVLLEVLGKPLLTYQIERLQRVALADKIVIATTVNPQDDPIAELAERLGVTVFRGPEDDVLGRYYGAAKAVAADVIVRVTADCPINDPEIINSVIAYYLERQPNLDLASTSLQSTYPRGISAGAFSFDCLEQAYNEATHPSEREHVTMFIHWRPERFRLAYLNNDEDYSRYRWTVDTIEDFQLIKTIIEKLYPSNPAFGWKDVLHLMEQHPELAEINAMIRQKPVISPN